MIIGKIRRWGNSMALLIPKDEATSLNLSEDQEVAVEITKKDNPLKELFGFSRMNKITRKEFLEARKGLESKWF
ncbi:AbrB/MazE/SpoVT family DNA-binding domain-containing protein [Candidatus Woesearchaeota archaeon]|nr:AbrB/MazE/SpoVT family DNA-binding domain-containing protein [Candidatus Woesearchaeota archaeon]